MILPSVRGDRPSFFAASPLGMYCTCARLKFLSALPLHWNVHNVSLQIKSGGSQAAVGNYRTCKSGCQKMAEGREAYPAGGEHVLCALGSLRAAGVGWLHRHAQQA